MYVKVGKSKKGAPNLHDFGFDDSEEKKPTSSVDSKPTPGTDSTSPQPSTVPPFSYPTSNNNAPSAPPSTPQILTEGYLHSLNVKELKGIMKEKGLDSSNCIEKDELIAAILKS